MGIFVMCFLLLIPVLLLASFDIVHVHVVHVLRQFFDEEEHVTKDV